MASGGAELILMRIEAVETAAILTIRTALGGSLGSLLI
jgi:hypothetical protein